MSAESSRLRIRLIVSRFPGLHLRELQRHLKMSFNSTRYHVNALTDCGDILRIEEGGYSRLYPRRMTESDKLLFSVVRRATDRRIITCLLQTGKASQGELGEQTGLAKSTISEHLSRLVRLGVVKTSLLHESRIVYEVADPDQVKALIGAQNTTLLSKATDRFIDLWDF